MNMMILCSCQIPNIGNHHQSQKTKQVSVHHQFNHHFHHVNWTKPWRKPPPPRHLPGPGAVVYILATPVSSSRRPGLRISMPMRWGDEHHGWWVYDLMTTSPQMMVYGDLSPFMAQHFSLVNYNLVGGDWNMYFFSPMFSIYLECHHPNWQSYVSEG